MQIYDQANLERYDQLLIEQFRAFGLYPKMQQGDLHVHFVVASGPQRVPGHLLVSKYQTPQDICGLIMAARAADRLFTNS